MNQAVFSDNGAQAFPAGKVRSKRDRTGDIPRPVTVSVFARAPVPGKSKSRLVPRLGNEGAAKLQERLTRHAVLTALAARLGTVELWCTPNTNHPSFSRFENDGVVLREQCEGDLGLRMLHAIECTCLHSSHAILIGSDCPAITPVDLVNAAHALRSGSDAVFIPAEDGGYALVGLKSVSGNVFRQIEWGTNKVMDQTREKLRSLRWQWTELTTRWDVDRPEDYDRLVREFPHLVSMD